MKKISLRIPRTLLAMRVFFFLICLISVRASAQAPGGTGIDPSIFPDSSFFQKSDEACLFLANSSGETNQISINSPETGTTSFSTMSAHKYLGYGTLSLAALAAISNSSHEIHRAASYAAAWLAGATCATGFAGYGNVIDLADGISINNVHAVAGTLGTAAFVATLILAEADKDSGHGTIGAASTAAIGISVLTVKIEW